MGGVGACYDNALIESFWSRMQVGLLDRHRWRTRLQLANVAVTFHDLGFPSNENILIARRETLEHDKNILVRYLRAVIKGWELNRKRHCGRR
jgi:transposase InsO family protein